MTKLLLVESPGKLKKLSQILGPSWIVKASMGHVRELASDGKDSLGFDLDGNTVKCRYVPRSQRGKDTIKQLQAAVRQVDRVVLATDPDREGETIAWHLKEALKLKNPQRVVYSEITAAAVQTAITNPRLIDMNLVNSGLARACLDKLVGYRGSPLLWSLNNGAKSMGRVQSATLHLLCQRERQIQAFVPQDYWSVFVDYHEGFRAYYWPQTSTKDQDPDAEDDANQEAPALESSRVLTQAEADHLVQQANTHSHQVTQVKGNLTTKKPPAPFITSTLQQAAGSKLRFSPEQTMQVAQKLYEQGLITYMRTDSVSLSPEFCAAVRQWLVDHDPQNIPDNVAKQRNSKAAQAAHEAIRPTDVNQSPRQLQGNLDTDAHQLYSLIWLRGVASQCQPAQLRKTQIITQSGPVYWQARGQVVEFAGYTRFWNNLSEDTELPTLQQGQALSLKSAAHEQKQTQPPPRYTEPKLVQLMELRGIGRPSTYAPTIQTLKQRQYVELLKGKLRPTTLGLDVDDFLAQALPDLLESDFTAQMEHNLDAIAAGETNWQEYLTTWNRVYFKPALDQAKQVIAARPPTNNRTFKKELEICKHPCPECNHPLAKVPSPKVSKSYFLKCVKGCSDVVLFWSDYRKQWEPPQAKNTVPQKQATANSAKLTQLPCPVCQAHLEEYSYTKDGQPKQLLRCSASKGKDDRRHKDVVYFSTKGGWWSPKLGELPVKKSP